MNKNELIRWLKSEKVSALATYVDAFELNRSKAEKQIYEDCKANDLIKSLNELSATEEGLINAFNKCNSGKMEFPNYYGHSDARSYIKITDSAYRSLRNSFGEQKLKIIENYDNVIRQVRMIPLKDAIDWLSELGFEIPETLTETRKNEIVVQVDPSYLYLKKESGHD